jgi:hypothetical protein
MKYVAKRQIELKQLYEMNRAAWREAEKKEEAAVKERRAKHHCTGCVWGYWESDKRVVCSRFPCVKSN